MNKKTMRLLPLLLLLAMGACTSKNNAAPETKTEEKPRKKTQMIRGLALASPTDTICGMTVKSVCADTLTLNGKLYGFCSTGCKEMFIQQLQAKR